MARPPLILMKPFLHQMAEAVRRMLTTMAAATTLTTTAAVATTTASIITPVLQSPQWK